MFVDHDLLYTCEHSFLSTAVVSVGTWPEKVSEGLPYCLVWWKAGFVLFQSPGVKHGSFSPSGPMLKHLDEIQFAGQ